MNEHVEEPHFQSKDIFLIKFIIQQLNSIEIKGILEIF